MRDTLLQIVRDFLRPRLKGGPVLLAYSGGGDSTALFHLVLKYREIYPLDLHVAHVDHGWREESEREALLLKDACPVPFYLHRLKVDPMEKNLEDRCRNLRLAFFYEIYQMLGAEALLMAHHANDQAETVLKRIFEGGSLHGILPDRDIEGMRVLRPLLGVQKKELIAYLEKEGISYFTDPTNEDERFLRGKMRKSIIPLLEEHFGKGIVAPLCRLAERSQPCD
ncbi:MAG: tRNA lysidine(34) synthetase TilS [Simkaniaceae bacterium]|nr:tRNA lysidine(34) synthetase TilS [Simkaniaceae bacterium]